MRIQITLITDDHISIPVNYQEYLTAAVYGYVNAGDVEYSKFVHDEGYLADGGKRFKPFTHSWIRVPASRRRVNGDRLHISPGTIGWVVSSPLDEFLQPFATGLLQTASLRLGTETIKVAAVEAVGSPEIQPSMRMTCLSPIVASVRRPDRTTQYLRPVDDPAVFSEAIRKNLVAKFKALTGQEPADSNLNFQFDMEYLNRNHDGTKKATYKGIDIIGILAPFTVSGSVELMRLGYDSGFGGKTACGFGCAEVRG
jgi:CRISPR-associated endoribonuclease Cas6